MVVDTSADKVNAVRILRKCTVMYPSPVDGATSQLTFNGGEVISDPTLSAWLITHVPERVVPIEAISVCVCVHCGATADRVANAEPIMIVLRDSSVTVGTAEDAVSTQFYRFRAGDVISHTVLRMAVLEAKIPVEFTAGVRCPNCRRCFY